MLTYGADSIPAEHRTQGLALFGLSGLFPVALGGSPATWSSMPLVTRRSSSSPQPRVLTSWLLVWRLPLLPILGHRPRRGFWAAFAQRNLLPLWWVTSCSASVWRLSSPLPGPTWAIGALARPVSSLVSTACPPPRCDCPGEGATTEFPNALSSPDLLAYGSGLVLMAIAANTAVIVMAALAAGMAHGALFPILTSQVVSRARTAERGSAMSIYTSIFDIALLVSAPRLVL